MDLEKLLAKRELCINDNPPSCVATCPIHVDVKGFMEQVQNKNFEKAYNILEKRMPMSRVIARVCDHPCENVCVRKEKGGSISISEVEKAIVEYGFHKKKEGPSIPTNNRKIAIIGGGISGLTCALDLEKKGYLVTIYERSDRLGGRLNQLVGDILPQEVLVEEIESIKKTKIKVKMGIEISKANIGKLQSEYEAIYIGTGKWEAQLNIDEITLATEMEGVFVGGTIATKSDSIILSVSTGKIAANSIDRYVQKTSLTAYREKESSYETELEIDTSELIEENRIVPSSTIYSREEAIKEAERCLLCECAKCYKACPHLQYEKLMPKEYIRKIHHNERVILGDRYANITINSCMVCGLCKNVCPTGLDMAEIIRDTRRSMVEREKMPPSAHDFALKDMEFNRSEYFHLLRHEPGMGQSTFIFFPGCQLCSSYPQYVDKSYAYLMEILEGGVGLYLNCCGAPGEWAGRYDLFQASINKIYSDWESMGKPIIILACSTCYYIFENYIPDIEIISLWKIFNEKGLPNITDNGRGKSLVVHDSCTARDYSHIYDSIRDIAYKLEYELIEPELTKKETQCCGYGGLAYFANREFSTYATDQRVQEKDGEYLAYCAMCRDLFVSRGKRTLHILDLIFGEDMEKLSMKKGPTLSERRNNRLKFKISILNKFWGEKLNLKEEYSDIDLIIDEHIKKLMEDRLILEADIKKVIGHSEENQNIFYNTENNHYLAFRRMLNVTYWVEYVKNGDSYKIITIYSHRMDVQGE